MTTFNFTGFAAADLFGDSAIRSHLSFTMPEAATLDISVTDNDHRLSGDAHRNERGDDTTGQHGTILRDGVEVGTGGRLYAENVWHLRGDDGQTYRLVELEQPGHQPDTFTFLGSVPPVGVTVTVQGAANVTGKGLSYDDLSAGALAAPTPNIVDIAAGSDDFNILVKALAAAGLVEAVQNATDITVFAPTDAAFTQLATDLGFDGDATDEDAIFGFIAEALAGLAPDGDPIPLLTDILLYHVSPGAKSADEVDAAEAITTLLDGATFGSEGTALVDNEPDIANPNIVIPNIAASNGTIQVIDRVLIPLDIPGNTPDPEPTPLPTLTEIVAASGGIFDQDNSDFDLLLNAVTTAGLADALNDPGADLTVFAPTDGAFVGLSQTLGFDGTDEGDAFAYLVEALTLLSGGGDPIPLLTQVLTYHVAPEALDSTAVLSSDGIVTLQGGTLTVDGTSLVDADPDVGNPNLIATDIQAANGIAHVLDGVLLPADLLQSDGSGKVDFIIGDDSNNHFRVGRDNDFVDGNGGSDFIWLGRGDDVGLGGSGSDIIKGGRGDDLIDGGTGTDYLYGGQGADSFVFRTGDGIDYIRRFEDGTDMIDLSGTMAAGFDDLHITQKGHVSIVNISEDQALILTGRGLDLGADDFVF